MRSFTKVIYDVVRNEGLARLRYVEPFNHHFANRLKRIEAIIKASK